MPDETTHKKCSLCKATKDRFEDFHKDASKKDGLRSQCIACRTKGGPVDGYMPDGKDFSDFVGESMAVKRKSTNYKIDKDGKPFETGGWLIAERDKLEQTKLLRKFIEGIFTAYEPVKPSDAPVVDPSDLAHVIVWGDPHIGLYACELETGNRFNLELAEQIMVESIRQAIEKMEPACEVTLATVGDTYHTDNFKNSTPHSNNALDSAGRYSEVVFAGGRIFRKAVDLLKAAFPKVYVKVVPGNHDPATSVGLQMALGMLYENEPRVEIDIKARPHQWHRFGSTLLGFNHGHRVKATEQALTMATDRAKDWGECSHYYMYTGHVHHETRKEIHKVKVETMNTLAGSDGYHVEGGYRSVRSMRVDTYHRRWGRINEATKGAAQILEQLKE